MPSISVYGVSLLTITECCVGRFIVKFNLHIKINNEIQIITKKKTFINFTKPFATTTTKKKQNNKKKCLIICVIESALFIVYYTIIISFQKYPDMILLIKSKIPHGNCNEQQQMIICRQIDELISASLISIFQNFFVFSCLFFL